MSVGHLMRTSQNFGYFESYVESCVRLRNGEVEVGHSATCKTFTIRTNLDR